NDDYFSDLVEGNADMLNVMNRPSASAVVNAGVWNANDVEVTRGGHGTSIANVGVDAVLTLDHFVAHHNESSVLVNVAGKATLTQSDVFKNSQIDSGLIANVQGTLDLFDVDV